MRRRLFAKRIIGWIRLPSAVLALALLAAQAGCGFFGDKGEDSDSHRAAAAQPSAARYAGEPSPAIPFVYTADRELSLTFNGLPDDQTLNRLLDELDKQGIKATFFVPGMRVAEEPDLAKLIVSRGHELENNTLNRLDMTKLSYEQIDREIRLADEVIERETGIKPRYLRTRSGDYNDDVRLAAAQEGMDAVIVYSLFLHNWKDESESEKYLYIRKYITRGGILAIDTDEFEDVVEAVTMIAKAAKDVGYRFIPLQELVQHGGERKPAEEIEGYDLAKPNTDYAHSQYKLIYNVETDKKVVALTFDDWGTDYTITKLLDILAEQQVKATFFLRVKGVEANPNLARAIVEAGHDVANHSYSHPVVTTLTPAELQADIVKAHQVLTYAIQQKPTMLFRPPTGEIDDQTARVIAAIGYPNIALYDVTSFDWDSANSASDIVESTLKQVKPGSVILLHMLDDIHTTEALPIIIERLKQQGYTFMTMADLIAMKP
ncbi:polysaccharide deacetylase family protein [Cohnella lubricantis]|uniref:Polysaccharide deacetylase family protein n=1 Tax=Cohnella lubricantis TaxID=2163172 RepID=A0A841T4P6_9BACL|nr:polysaccharide deacetylase family protein [Cohnella lubricantis]MBB6676304.1 polysaccharide deacetylase family protein [Cohnella lubricantis]MBP2119626.1 peptidoglycan/xylan/chitin deacetylase (PgdA/CDA1 family) [Cohnella lubricantis]